MKWLTQLFSKILGTADEPAQEDTQTNIPPRTDAPLTPELLFDLEENLLRADCGFEFSAYIVEQIRSVGCKTLFAAEEHIVQLCRKTLSEANKFEYADGTAKKHIYLIVGVNGAGKTTTIGKLAHALKQQGRKVLIVPCDTFRAAAESQLATWAQRSKSEFFTAKEAKRPDAILFEAMQSFRASSHNNMIVDTAGRLQSKTELMDELAKLNRVIDKNLFADCKVQRLLVLDSTTGQNGYVQAKMFHEVTPLDGIVLSKFDGSAKGGIVLNIAHNLKTSVCYVGTGEGISDLQRFDMNTFLDSTFKR